MSETHLEWQKEQERVDFVHSQIKKKQNKLKQHAASLKQGIIGLRETFWEDVTVNLEEQDDVIETQASIKQQAELLSERERSHGLLYENLKKLTRLEDSPYFGRIDFFEQNETASDSIYIGIASLLDEQEENFLIYDWRAPISSLYYDYPPGPAHYETMDGTISGDLELKRQFIIKKAQIKGLFDTGITIGDRLLQEILGNQANTKMKSIVATIQKEQNQIIRNEKSKILVVQGVAGSGKTSAALQRVAYLLYTHRETLNSQNMMLFSPNPLFNSYISTVLPELGEENMKQTTYKQFMESLISTAFELEDPFMQMEAFLGGENQDRISVIPYKSSLEFKNLIQIYLSILSTNGLMFRNIGFRGQILISAEEIHNYFYQLDQQISIPNRMRLTAEWLLKEISIIEKQERDEDWVIEEMQLLEKEDFLEVHNELQQKNRRLKETFDDGEQEERILRKKIVQQHFKPLKKRVKRYGFVNILESYLRLFTTQDPSIMKHQPRHWDTVSKVTQEALADKKLFWEDATPFLFFRDKLIGRKSFAHIRHIFIDEFQDYSPFQFDYLKELFRGARMTLLGDLNQAIYPHSEVSQSLLSGKEGSLEDEERIILTRSYRSTRQIVEFTRTLVQQGELIIPFNREGEKPEIIKVITKEDQYKRIVTTVKELISKGYETIALICKTIGESEEAYERLRFSLDIQLMNQTTTSYSKGVVVLPAYLAKGIEFDSVVIHDASQEVYRHESERNLFYTACTRAMHTLTLITVGDESTFIKKIPSDKYQFKKM
ncbi:DNA helicase-2/ATP-dependent DNA helicase PcrA [Peribacillus deserti]|uniref:DNA helicase-2/ATP-dependent DNA helicase PcrA n=1 Tax=Peribacillus deserti TaxID=673318 RepID=A0ABS2QCY2_9BACI|nr:RNA polymerase recycling motor HelD [Peribacillus deserti]MBM7691012.1 DNA helicase-2/ATP-dependent DNA helicase PcrA [Peribacillus deserti]